MKFATEDTKMTLEDALAIMAYFALNTPATTSDRAAERAAISMVGEHAKQAVNRFTAVNHVSEK